MRPIVPRHIVGIDEPQIGFVDQRRGLEAMPRTLSGHASARDLMKLPLYERNQPAQGGFVALTPFQKQSGGLRGMLRNVAILALFDGCTGLRNIRALQVRRRLTYSLRSMEVTAVRRRKL
jgi:hypothetical protein